MGQPRRIRQQYVTPMHPWQKSRIDQERDLRREYGLKAKHEIWKEQTILDNMIANFKKTGTTEQAKKEKRRLIERMERLGIISHGASDDEILGLDVRAILDRRLQTIVCKQSLAHTMKQARQFIIHRHIKVGDKIITSPSYLVTLKEQEQISFVDRSALSDEKHPERVQIEKPSEEKAQEKPKEKSKETPAQAAPVEIEDDAEPIKEETKEESKEAAA